MAKSRVKSPLENLPGEVMEKVVRGLQPYQKHVLAGALGIAPYRDALTRKDALDAASNGDFSVAMWISQTPGSFVSLSDLMLAAVGGGHLATLKQLHTLEKPGDRIRLGEIMCEAVRSGGLPTVAWMLANMVPSGWGCVSVPQCAAKEGNLEALKLLTEADFLKCSIVCLYAAEQGRLDVLTYLHENGYPWDERVCDWAAEKGHLECLKYAHENGADLGDCKYSAAYYGHLDCLKYAHENGSRMDSSVVYIAEKNGRLECLQYAQLHLNHGV